MADDPPKTTLLDLPGEIRNTIWGYTFGDLTFHTYSPDFVQRDARRFSNTRWSTSLFGVSRQVRQEATSAFSDNLSVHCDYTDICRLNTYPAFIMLNLTKLVVSDNVGATSWGLNVAVEDWRNEYMPKLQTLAFMPKDPIHSGSQGHIHSYEDLVTFLRGGFDRAILEQSSYPIVASPDAQCAEGMTEENLRVLWKVEPKHALRQVCFRYLYRLDFAPATWKIHTRRINVSQSRSYLFGEWVPAEEVVLMIDEVSFPVVYSVKRRTGRVLASTNQGVEIVERELEDEERLEKALAKAFRCG